MWNGIRVPVAISEPFRALAVVAPPGDGGPVTLLVSVGSQDAPAINLLHMPPEVLVHNVEGHCMHLFVLCGQLASR